MQRLLHRLWTSFIALATHRQLLFLAAFTAYCLVLVTMRYVWTHKLGYSFLVWNIFLAWMPVFFSFAANFLHQQTRSFWLVLVVLVPWLLFLPNAPYIITDLVHLRPRAGVPYWYDILLMSSFAFNGLLLGFYSMAQMHKLIVSRLNPTFSWILMAGVTVGTAYGIYLGRVLRWNSWDILRHPFRIAMDCVRPILHPFTYKEAVVMTIVFSGLLFLGYLVFHARVKQD